MVDSYSPQRHLPRADNKVFLSPLYYKKEKVMKIADFIEEVKEGTTIVDFWAEWCGPCKMVTPVLEQLAEETGARLLKINVDENQELAEAFNITSIPVISLYVDGSKTAEVIGAKPKPALKKALFGE
jgi:thioredoxin 1